MSRISGWDLPGWAWAILAPLALLGMAIGADPERAVRFLRWLAGAME